MQVNIPAQLGQPSDAAEVPAGPVGDSAAGPVTGGSAAHAGRVPDGAAAFGRAARVPDGSAARAGRVPDGSAAFGRAADRPDADGSGADGSDVGRGHRVRGRQHAPSGSDALFRFAAAWFAIWVTSASITSPSLHLRPAWWPLFLGVGAVIAVCMLGAACLTVREYLRSR